MTSLQQLNRACRRCRWSILICEKLTAREMGPGQNSANSFWKRLDSHSVLRRVSGGLRSCVEVNGGSQEARTGEIDRRKQLHTCALTWKRLSNQQTTLLFSTNSNTTRICSAQAGIFPGCMSNGLQVGLFKGLTPASRCPDGPRREPLTRIAKAHGMTGNAVLLAWIIQSNIVAVTTTTKAGEVG
jgi:hypothetical protein